MAVDTANASDDHVQPLSLSDALLRAEVNAPDLVAAHNALRLTEARRTGAATWLPSNPLLSLLIGQRSEVQSAGPPLRGIQHQLHMEQAIEVAAQRWARLDAVATAIDVQRDTLGYARISARAWVKGLYVQCVLVERRLTVAQRREDIARQLVQSAEKRLALGATGAIEANLARIEVSKVIADRIDIAAERELRLAELRIATGLSPTVELKLTTTELADALPAVALDGDVNQRIEDALSHRLDLSAIRKQSSYLVADARRLRREVVPNLVLSVDYQQDLTGQIFIGGTVGVTLPIFQRNQGPLSLLQAAERARQAEEKLLTTRIRAEVSQALQTLRLRRIQIEGFAHDALPPAEENVSLLLRGWQAGKFDLFRVITALREMTEIRSRYLSMLEQMWLAGILFERASGVEVLMTEHRDGSMQ